MEKQHLELTKQDKDFLHTLLSKGELSVKKMKRSTALLELDKGKTFIEVQGIVNVSYPTLLSWAKKYKAEGLTFLDDKPRSGRRPGISPEERAKITALACSEAPEGYARWSLRLLADKVVELEIVESISFRHVGNILKKTNYNPIEKGSGVSEK